MTAFSEAPTPVADYYRILDGGIDSYDRQDLLPLLDDDLVFQGPVGEPMTAGKAGFAEGFGGFIANCRGIVPIQLVTGGDQAAALYDAALPGGVMRFAEFFIMERGVIRELRLLFDPADYAAKVEG